ncbi:MAG: RNA-binding cell elongation regulator Jag/EloR [Evtepia gabavorous]
MLKWIEATGRSEEAAIQNALAQLGLDRDSVSVEVLERARNGFLGFGSSPAKVKVTYEVSQEEAPVSPVEEIFAPAPSRSRPRPRPVRRRPPQGTGQSRGPGFPVPGAKPGDLEERIRAFLSGLLAHMGVEAAIHVSPKGDNGILVTLEGPKLGALIGHRGETLDAIQQLTNYAVNRGRTHRVRIHIDAEHYRAKREESLKRLANKVAVKVVKYRRNITLEPMNAYERHVIHETLQDYPDVITYSTGTEPNRRTVVAFSRGKHAY